MNYLSRSSQVFECVCFSKRYKAFAIQLLNIAYEDIVIQYYLNVRFALWLSQFPTLLNGPLPVPLPNLDSSSSSSSPLLLSSSAQKSWFLDSLYTHPLNYTFTLTLRRNYGPSCHFFWARLHFTLLWPPAPIAPFSSVEFWTSKLCFLFFKLRLQSKQLTKFLRKLLK